MPTYGRMKVAANGNSFMDFSMQLSAVGVRDGASDKSIPLGTWKAGFSSNMSLLDPKSMGNYTADIVYRVVTVLVSFGYLYLTKNIMTYFSKNLSFLKTKKHQKAFRATVSI